MRFRKTVSVLLASAIALPCAVGLAACNNKKPDDTAIKGETAYGNVTVTDTVKNPSRDVTIKLIRGKNVLKTDVNELNYSGALETGDVIEIDSDYQYINLNLFGKLGEQLIYSPSGQFVFQIPSTRGIYDSTTFSGTDHTFTASVAGDADVNTRRNLALNPYDYLYIDEQHDQTAADKAMAADLVDSKAIDQVTAFPHAYANRVTRNEADFFARNAIDGGVNASNHGSYPYQSWGYDKKTDAEFTVYFGREVTLDQVGFVLRADYSVSNGKEHDTYWEGVTLQFSDGSTQEIGGFAKSGDLQTFELSAVTTSYVRIKEIQEVQNSNSEMYAALTEFEAYGTEKTESNTPAVKTAIRSTLGMDGKSKFTTKDYTYDEIKAIMDKSNDWFINITETTNFQIPDYNGNAMQVKINDAGWKDGVYYSGLTEAFLTTGDLNEYYFLRAVGDQFSYKINKGNNTPHGDDCMIGESYLMLNDFAPSAYKLSGVSANADFNVGRDLNDTKTPTNGGSGEWIDPNRDWSHMGWWWCDALYMSMNTYTLMTLNTGNPKYAETAYEAYKYWKAELFNDTYNLWWRDSTQKPLSTGNVDPDTGSNYPVFWARGNAWVLSALAKQLTYLDREQFPEAYAEYEQDFKDLAEALVKYQRADGTWNASIVDEKYYGGKETTGTLGFIYGMCVGLRLGVLDSKTFYPVVKDAWDGVVENCIFESGQVGYMQTTGFQPQNYNSEETSKNNTHEFGMGLFLLACSGMMSICDDYEAPQTVIPATPQAAGIA